MAIRVQQDSENFGRCGCGRRDYCDGSHGLSEEQWRAVQAKERECGAFQAVETVADGQMVSQPAPE